MKRNQKGFGTIEILLLLILVAFVAFAGWYVWDTSKNNDKGLSSTDKSSEEVSTQLANMSLDKEYVNKDVSLSFKYPDTWKLEEDLKDYNRGGVEGSIYITSPSGMKVFLSPNFGGKGGDCEPYETDKPHKTKNCNTLEVLSKEKVFSNNGTGVYLFHAKYTPSQDRSNNEETAPQSVYAIFMSDNESLIKADEPLIGLWDSINFFEINSEPGLQLDTGITNAKNNSPDFYNTIEAKTVDAIYRSIKILN